MAEFEVNVDHKCPKCGYEDNFDTTVDIEPSFDVNDLD